MSGFPRRPEERIQIGQSFRDRDDHHFWVALVEDEPIGGCGVIEQSGDVATIRWLGVERGLRGRGIGRHLVEVAMERTNRPVIVAETDDDATGFYRKCGFSVQSIGEKYPGVIRYVCRYIKPPSA